jgi:hypothetical protein
VARGRLYSHERIRRRRAVRPRRDWSRRPRVSRRGHFIPYVIIVLILNKIIWYIEANLDSPGLQI